MKQLYSFLLVVIFCFLTTAAMSQIYSYKISQKDNTTQRQSSSIIFSIGKSHYSIDFSHYYGSGWCSQIISEKLSYGSVWRYADTIIIRDVRGAYNMKLAVEDSTLKVINGFESFKNIDFKYSHEMSTDDTDSLYISLHEDLLNSNNSLMDSLFTQPNYSKNKQPDFFEFTPASYTVGTPYKADGSTNATNIYFDSSSYEYSMHSLLLTKGQWCKIGNYILLKDTTLNSYFILKITGDNKFNTEVFPFANSSLEFRKSK